MLLVSAGFAIAFEDEEVIKHRSTIVGLVGAAIDLSALWLLPLGIAWSLAGAAFTTPAARIAAVG